MNGNGGDDLLAKVDALLTRHRGTLAGPHPPDIPVLTELVVPPEVDLANIPVLTEEVPREAASRTVLPPEPESAPASDTPIAPLCFELPPDARYLALDAASDVLPPPAGADPPQASPPALASPPPAPLEKVGAEPVASATPLREEFLSQVSVQRIADLLEAELVPKLEARLAQTVAREVQHALHGALDRALSSLLEQFAVHLEEVVKNAIEVELAHRDENRP